MLARNRPWGQNIDLNSPANTLIDSLDRDPNLRELALGRPVNSEIPGHSRDLWAIQAGALLGSDSTNGIHLKKCLQGIVCERAGDRLY